MHKLALDAPSPFGPECRPRSILFFQKTGNMCGGGGGREGEKERQREREGRVICSGGNSAVK